MAATNADEHVETTNHGSLDASSALQQPRSLILDFAIQQPATVFFNSLRSIVRP